jgi:hypothetical protein
LSLIASPTGRDLIERAPSLDSVGEDLDALPKREPVGDLQSDVHRCRVVPRRVSDGSAVHDEGVAVHLPFQEQRVLVLLSCRTSARTDDRGK